ncbi:MAG: hypothetical protein JSS14_17890 [Proteobacteria bacterium]|nr:hypothetical protein [Pseudomonadota bacterium]
MYMQRLAKKSWAASLFGLLVTSAMLLGHSDSTLAQTSVTTCTGSTQPQYSPGLILTPRLTNVTFSETYGSCTSTSQPAIASATVPTVTVQQERSCATLADTTADPITQTVTWNTGQTSTFQYTRTVTNVGGVLQVTGTGMVTSGLFQGASVVRSWFLQTSIRCRPWPA